MRVIPDALIGYKIKDALIDCGGSVSRSDGGLDLPLPAIVTDSREVDAGDVFIALKGENFDGHNFIPAAISRGAAYVICGRGRAIDGDAAFIEVDDTLRALGDVSRGYLQKLSPPIVAAVTGSVGKTTTKEYLSSLLSVRYKTHKTGGNFNNLIGLPLTVLSAPADTEAIVLEMGMSARGEIDRLAEIARPNLAIITSIGTSHIEHLGSRENICLAKCELLAHLREGAKVYLPANEPLLDRVKSDRYETIRVSTRPSNVGRIHAENIKTVGEQTVADIVGDECYISLVFPTLGEHCLADALLTVEAVRDLGYRESEIREGLLGYRPAGMRQLIREVEGIKLIEDCYNASPESMRASLDVLASIETKDGARRAALLGDMYELGECSTELHFAVGAYAAGVCDLLFTLGRGAVAIAEGAASAGMPRDRITVFDDISLYSECGAAMADRLSDGDVVLVKASRATAAERATAAFEKEIKTNTNKG